MGAAGLEEEIGTSGFPCRIYLKIIIKGHGHKLFADNKHNSLNATARVDENVTGNGNVRIGLGLDPSGEVETLVEAIHCR